MREGNSQSALTAVAKSAFRRFPRLFLPAAVVTLIAWFLCQLGAFEVAKHCDSVWLSWTSPPPKSLGQGIISLFWNVINTWIAMKNEYDDHQWTLFPLVKGAMMVYVVLCGVAFMETKYRMLSAAMLYVYFYCCGEGNFSMQFFYGMLLCDISQDTKIQTFIARHRMVATVMLPIFLISAGLFFCSFPAENAHWTEWSSALLRLRQYILPQNLPLGDASIPWMYTGIGLDLIALGLQLSPLARKILSNRFFLWFGKNSFAVYLTHGTMLRVVLARMLYGNFVPAYVEKKNDAGELIPQEPMHLMGWAITAIAIPVWFVLVYVVAHLWTTYVDAWAARMSKRLEDHVFVKEEKSIMR
ncbi:acyltransferase [Phlyctema vagabunda]|uniref:Acyltransferase n=1 Tax=Phlyctema vagabunda TaxID=108571 RepID=A0ABR4PH20_9HELO